MNFISTRSELKVNPGKSKVMVMEEVKEFSIWEHYYVNMER